LKKISRRNIIKTLSLGGAAVIYSPQSLFSIGRTGKDKLGVALVGLGYYSTDLLAPALQLTKHC
jgi:glucose-fructose oxidoreductase